MKQNWRKDLYKLIDFNPSMSKKEKDALVYLLDDKIIPSIIKSEQSRLLNAVLGKQKGYKYGFKNPRYVLVEDILSIAHEEGVEL